MVEGKNGMIKEWGLGDKNRGDSPKEKFLGIEEKIRIISWSKIHSAFDAVYTLQISSS